MNKIVTANSAQETEELGFRFAKEIKPQDVVCLYGDLGSGKTTFVKGFSKGLGISSRIISPTFVLVRTHTVSSPANKIKTMYHLDLYRLENELEIETIGLLELFEDKNGVVLIEWAEKAKSFLPEKRIDIHFETVNLSSRKIKISSL